MPGRATGQYNSPGTLPDTGRELRSGVVSGQRLIVTAGTGLSNSPLGGLRLLLREYAQVRDWQIGSIQEFQRAGEKTQPLP